MTWFKVDDRLPTSRKLMRIPRSKRTAAIGLWTLAGAWSLRELSDGFIPAYVIEELAGEIDEAEALVNAGLWESVEREGDDGYIFHNWAEYQPTREQVEADRESARLRKQKQRRNAKGEFAGEKGVTEMSHRDTPVTPEMSQGCHTVPVPSRPVPS